MGSYHLSHKLLFLSPFPIFSLILPIPGLPSVSQAPLPLSLLTFLYNVLKKNNPEGKGGERGGKRVQDEGTHVNLWPIHVDVWINYHNI